MCRLFISVGVVITVRWRWDEDGESDGGGVDGRFDDVDLRFGSNVCLSSARWDRIEEKSYDDGVDDEDDDADDDEVCDGLSDWSAALIWSAMSGPTSPTTIPLIWFTNSFELSLSLVDDEDDEVNADDDALSSAFNDDEDDALARDDFAFLSTEVGESECVSDASDNEVVDDEMVEEGDASDDNDDAARRLICK